jgi:hypothetical protein
VYRAEETSKASCCPQIAQIENEIQQARTPRTNWIGVPVRLANQV